MFPISMNVLVVLVFFLVFMFRGVYVIMEYERGVIFRLGRARGIKLAGLRWIVPFIDRMVKVSLRTVVMDVPPQDVITKDNVSLKVNAVVYFRVMDPMNAIVQVEDFLYATSQLAQTTLRSILGQHDLDQLLSERDKINRELQTILDQASANWGIKVSNVEVKHIDLPQEMQRAMARQAEAERERRAKIIHAEGELQASTKLGEAAEIIARNPMALQLRYMQTMVEVSSQQNTKVLLPIPLDVFKLFASK
jgi:regulator of protease activity HflC (stomatin/prohibitin superfamily)